MKLLKKKGVYRPPGGQGLKKKGLRASKRRGRETETSGKKYVPLNSRREKKAHPTITCGQPGETSRNSRKKFNPARRRGVNLQKGNRLDKSLGEPFAKRQVQCKGSRPKKGNR